VNTERSVKLYFYGPHGEGHAYHRPNSARESSIFRKEFNARELASVGLIAGKNDKC